MAFDVQKSRLRVVVIGKEGLFTASILRSIANNHSLAAIVESAPRNYGRPGLPRSKFKSFLMKLKERRDLYESPRFITDRKGIPYLPMDRTNQAMLMEFLKKARPDVVCIATMSQALTKEALLIPKLGTINVHPSLLPKYRGPNPWFWQYHQMEREGGVSVVIADEGSDTGNILQKEKFSIPLGMPFPDMLSTISALGAKLVLQALNDISEGKEGETQRNKPCPLYARRVTPEENLVDWENWPIERVWHVVKGTQRWIRGVRDPKLQDYNGFWSVQGFTKEKTRGKPGTLSHDGNGLYFVHPEGRIHVSNHVSY